MKTIFKDSKEVIMLLCIKMWSTSLFLDITKFADFLRKNTDVNIIQGVCHVIHTFLESSLGKGTCAKFHHCIVGYVWQIWGGGILPIIREQPQKGPSWILLRSKLQNCNRYFVEGTLDIEMVDFHNQLPGLFGQ